MVLRRQHRAALLRPSLYGLRVQRLDGKHVDHGGYAKNDITIIGTDPGVTATMNGGTHMPFEDVALYRALPGSTVIQLTARSGWAWAHLAVPMQLMRSASR